MNRIIAHDVVNDVAIIETDHGVYVRYGLQHSKHPNIEEAARAFSRCQRHAILIQEEYP